MSSETTITILPTHLRLVHIPLGEMHSLMSRILDCWWFRRKDDPFFALCHNGVELSLFADAKAVRRCFVDCMGAHSAAPSSADKKGKAREEAEDEPVVGDDLWIALEVAFGGNGWEDAAPRLHALTSPLAAAGLSIFFVSTFFADYILLRSSALPLATSILENEGFDFAEADEGMEAEMRAFREREGEELSAAAGGTRTTKSPSGGVGGGSADDEGDGTSSSMMGSLVLSDAGSAGAGGSRERSGSRTGSAASASRSNSMSLSRSGSLSMSAATPVSPPLATASPIASPSLAANAAPGFSTTSPDAPPLSLLPDELVCVGLSPSHESVWRSKIVETLFFPERVLPRPSAKTSASPLASAGARTKERSDTPPRPPSHIRPTPLRTASTSLPTPFAPHPTPFVALTQTAEGTSLIADVRLLRKMFCGEKDGEGEEGLVFVVGEGGLGGLWEGEEGLEGWEVDEDDEEGSTASEDESASSVRSSADGQKDWEPSSPTSSTTGGTSADGDEQGGGMVGGASERTLLKCLQLDLTRFGLDKPGLVEHYASLLIEGGVRSLLYQSTFGSANILVAKRDVGKARRLLMKA